MIGVSIATAQSTEPFHGNDVIVLDQFEVRTDEGTDSFDQTGMGYLEAELNDPPFSNNLLAADYGDEDLNNSLVSVGDYVDTYADQRRALLTYPGYTYLSLGLGYRWKHAKNSHSLNLRVQNLLNEDLLARAARPGAERSASINYRLSL